MRGTFVFPADDTDLLQMLEIRGNNGAVEDVETVYILTGSTYYVPERLFACDDPGMYNSATAGTVGADHRMMGRTVESFYRDRPSPNMVCWVHTHPNGLSRPSDGDVEFGTERELSYDAWCGDYEFFHLIHGLGDTVRIGHPLSGSDTVRPEEVRQPEQTDVNKVSWIGETREHTLAVYDKEFDPRPVEVLSAADMQPTDATVGFQPGLETGPGPEPGGEIWD